jgi:acetyl-CoA acetyltransferase family protein
MPLNAYIVEAVRTPGGRRNGKLSKYNPADLGAVVVNELLARTKIDPAQVDDVIFGCVDQIGSQAANLGRNVVLASKLPISVPGTTVDRQCGSSQQAIHFAAQAVMSGNQDCVIAGGVEVMSLVPIGSSTMDGISTGRGNPFEGKGIQTKWPGVMFSQFEGAELVAQKWNVTRQEMEEMAVQSHKRAAEATKEGRFKREIVPVPVVDDKTGATSVLTVDEGIRWPSSVDKLAQLPALKPGGRITAGTSSQITDGAAAVLIVNEHGLKKLGLRPRARIVQMAVIGSDPVMMLSGPIPATELVLSKAKLTMQDMDLYEVNEAFASVPGAWAKALKADPNKLNVNGGAMALGHPLGATGAKLMTTLLHELERRGARYGLQAICEGGGTANATIIERITSASKL